MLEHDAKSESFSIDDLLGHRVIVVLGKGGVGRTSIAIALALCGSGHGMRTRIIETDPQRPISAGYGQKPGLEPVELEPRLWSLFLGGQESLEDYLGLVVPRPILHAVFATSLYQYFVNAAPAVRELTMMGKIYHEIERRPKDKPPWDVIVVDAPASGQALAMVKMPFVARETFGGGMVGSEAGEVAAFFRDHAKCAMIVVTTAETLAISETLEIHHALENLQLSTEAVLLNRASTGSFEAVDVTRMITRASRNLRLRHVNDLAEIARADLRRRNHERRALGIIHRQIKAPALSLKEHRDLFGRRLGAALAAELAGGTSSIRNSDLS
ncbi:MAG TPA: ArsA-related P-loop ATPase [Candidatus Binataceae bacterium]|nr:ArsA-related P-loop ATPase [Candidatus Binataceae bacterium]